MKQLYFCLSIIFMLLCHNVGAYDFYATAPSGQRLYYRIVNGNAVVTYKEYHVYSQWEWTYYYNGTKPAGNLIIPDSVTYRNSTYSVTGIDKNAFYECTGLTSVSIGNNVRYIGNYAFYHCSGLVAITLPDSLLSIRTHAFDCDTSLASLKIPNTLDSIGNAAFISCARLDTITIPDNVISLGDSVFYSCLRLKTATIGRGVTSLNAWTFMYCNVLSTLRMRGNPPILRGGNNLQFYYLRPNLYANCGTLYSYQNNSSWNNLNIIDACVTITTSANDPTRGGVSGGGNYMIGDTVTLTAIPFPGSSFIGWSTGSQVNPLKFVASQSQSITAAFGSGPLFTYTTLHF